MNRRQIVLLLVAAAVTLGWAQGILFDELIDAHDSALKTSYVCLALGLLRGQCLAALLDIGAIDFLALPTRSPPPQLSHMSPLSPANTATPTLLESREAHPLDIGQLMHAPMGENAPQTGHHGHETSDSGGAATGPLGKLALKASTVAPSSHR